MTVSTGNAGIWFALPCLGFTQSQLPSPRPSGHFICMAHPTTENTISVVEILLRGGLGCLNSFRSGAWRDSGRDLAIEAARVSLKTRESTERRRARGATHIAVWRTMAQIIMENVTYFEHLQKDQFLVPNQGAPNATHSERFRT